MKKTLERTRANVSLVEIGKIRQHEETDPGHLSFMMSKIRQDGVFTEPIVIDGGTMTVLDGHHRLNSCILLGLKKIPCLIVDYEDKGIRVVSRRPGIEVSKQRVREISETRCLFPCKTTKHFIPGRIKKINVPLCELA
ncbi:MAG: ParB N-terminal domain-containing protein [Nanoarchaeota archaeon]|nr:ParB N-terminal domain-containing protein [Nanoarchaeota archaeon]